jgi:hypothetical protein
MTSIESIRARLFLLCERNEATSDERIYSRNSDEIGFLQSLLRMMGEDTALDGRAFAACTACDGAGAFAATGEDCGTCLGGGEAIVPAKDFSEMSDSARRNLANDLAEVGRVGLKAFKRNRRNLASYSVAKIERAKHERA